MRGSGASVCPTAIASALSTSLEELGAALEALARAPLGPAERGELHRARTAAGRVARALGQDWPVPPPTLPDPMPPPLPDGAAAADSDGHGDGMLEFDRARYRRLIEIAGVDSAQELIERLLSDLRQVERGLLRGLAEPSTAEIRAQTHVLVALAGAVGATGLQHLAEALNAAAHTEAPAEIAELGARTLAQLGQLSRFIAAQEAAGRPPA